MVVTFKNRVPQTAISICLILFSHYAAYGASFRTIFTGTEVTVGEIPRGSCPLVTSISLDGDIVDGDAAAFEKELVKLKSLMKRENCTNPDGIFVSANSNGGLVNEAMKIGRIIRKNGMRTSVASNQKCFSSCVLLHASGVSRNAFGHLGIHRPYFENLAANLPYERVRELRIAIISDLKKFAIEMDFSEKLIDDMLAIPPNEMKILTIEQQKEYRIFGLDPTAEERTIARSADIFGLTSAEFRKRSSEASACSRSTPDGGCRLSIMLRIPIEEAKRRNKRFADVCNPADMVCMKNTLVYGR